MIIFPGIFPGKLKNDHFFPGKIEK